MALKLNELIEHLYPLHLKDGAIGLGQDSYNSPIEIKYWNVDGVPRPTNEQLAIWMLEYEFPYRLNHLNSTASYFIQSHIDRVAALRNYSSGISCVSYAYSNNPQWKAEAEAFIAWRDAVWIYALEQFELIKNSQRPLPSVDELLDELPQIIWPQT